MPLPDGMHKDVVIVADNIAWRRWCSDFSDHDLASVIMSTAAICDGSFDPVAAYGEPAIKLDRLDLEAMTRMEQEAAPAPEGTKGPQT